MVDRCICKFESTNNISYCYKNRSY
jgi:hypothetical protein